MAVYVYRSTDSGAPTLSGTAGSMIGVLDACLVNGYGAKSPVGWAKAYSGTNLAAYRAPAGNRFYLRVDDTGTTSARVRGYEVLTNISTGTGPFPTDTQLSGGAYFHKSSSADGTARPWRLYSDGKIFYFFVASLSTSYGQTMVFGEFTSYISGDAYNTILTAGWSASYVENSGASTAGSLGDTTDATWLARSYTQTGASLAAGKHGDFLRCSNVNVLGGGGFTYPAADGRLWVTPVWVHETSPRVVRGVLPGFYAPCHTRPLAQFDTFTGSGAYAGRSFEVLGALAGVNEGQIFIETSTSW